MTKKIANYEAPRLTVVEFRTERGYAGSPSPEGTFVIQAQQLIDAQITNEVIQMQMGQVEDGKVIASNMFGNEDNSNAGSSSGWQYANGGWF